MQAGSLILRKSGKGRHVHVRVASHAQVQYRSCYQKVHAIGRRSHMILPRAAEPHGQFRVRGRWML